MAEKIKIAEIDIDFEKAVADAVEMKKEVGLLKARLKEVKDTTGETSAEYVKYSAELKAATSKLRSHEQMLQKTVETDRAELGSLEQIRARLSVVSKQWAALSIEERKNSDIGKNLANEKLILTNALKEEEAATGDARRNVGNYQSALEGLPGPLGRATSGIKMMTKSVLAFLATPIGIVIAAIVAGLAALTSWFKRSEEGQNALTKVVAVFKTVLNNILDIIDKVGEAIFNAFNNPKQAVKDLWEFIKSQIVNRLTGLIDMFKALDKVITSVFTLDLEKAKEGAREFGESTIQVMTGVDDAINKVRNSLQKFAEEHRREMELTRNLEDQKASLRKIEREHLVTTAKLQRDIAQLRAKNAERDKYTAEERIAFLDEAIALENKLMDTDLQIARQKAQIHAQEIAMSNSTIEDLDEQARLEAHIFEVEKSNADKRRTILAERRTALADYAKQQGQLSEEAIAQMRAETEAFIENVNERKSIQAQIESDLLTISEEYHAKKAEAMLVNWQNEQAILEQTYFGQLDLEKQRLEESKAQELAFADKIGADKLLIEKKYAKAEREIERAKRDAKLELALEAAKGLAELFGETTAAGKAAAVAMVTIETYRAAQAAMTGMLETFPGPWGIAAGLVAAGLQVALGIANVRKILAVSTEGTGAGPSASTGGGAAQASSGSNMVSTQASIGQGIVTRETVSGQLPETARETVLVVDDVTSAQNTESNKVKTSTL